MKYRHTVIVGLILSLAVVAFGSNHPYISNPGTLIYDFEDVNDWNVSGAGATAENDTTYFKQGSQSIKLNAVDGTYSIIQQVDLSLDFSSGDGFSMRVYVADKNKVLSFGISVTSTTDWSKHFGKGWSTTEIEQGWNYLNFSKSEFTNHSNDSWNNTMVKMRFTLTPQAGEDTSVSYDDLRFGIIGQPKVIMTFDDSEVSQIDKAYPIMAANNQEGVAFIPTSRVGWANKMSLTDLQTLSSAGWDISNHTQNHNDLTAVSQAVMEADIDGGYDWLVANGFEDTAKFFAYPYARDNDTVVSKLKQRHVLGRTGSSVRSHFDIVNFEDLQYKLSHYFVTNLISVADVQTEIDRVIERSGLLILMFHFLVDSDADLETDYLTADFQAISDYLKTKQDAGLLEVITFSDYYNALIELEPFCLEEPAMDFNGDCKVDFADFAIFTQSWLECNLDPESACWE